MSSSSGSSSTTTPTTDTARAARSPAWATATPSATAAPAAADSPAATSAMWRVGPSTKPTSTTTYATTPSHSTSTSPLPARSPPPAQHPPYPTPPLTSATQSNGGDGEQRDEKPAAASTAPSAPSAPSAAASSHHDEEHDEVLDDATAPASNSAGSPSRPGTTATSPTITSPPALSTTASPAVPIVKPKLRASRACSSCNRQKLRCDGQNPCGRCIGLGQAKVCEYLPSLRGKTRKKKGAVSAVAGGVPVPAAGAVGTATTSANGSRVTSPSEPHLAGSKRRRSLEGFAREYEYEYARWHALARNGVGAWGGGGSERERAEHRDRDREQREREQAYYVAERERDARDREEHHREHERQQQHQQRSRANSAHSVHSAHSAHSPRSRQPPTLTPVQRLTPLPPAAGGDALSILAEASAISPVERVRDVRSGDLRERERERGERRREWSPRAEVAPVSDACEAKHLLGFVNAHEAENLFNLYVRYLNPHLPVLDTSTPQGGVAIHVARRSIALFNAVCCVSARAFNVVLWDRLKAFAAGEASRLVLDRSFEAVQAQMVYATWNLPTEDGADAAYVRFGLAKRLAEDIDLPAALASPLPGWAKRSIARTSLLLYSADATLALELGKPVLVRDVSSWAAQLDGGGVDDLLVSIFAEWAHALTTAVDSLRAHAATWSTNTSPAAGVYAAAAPDVVGTHRARFASWRERAGRRVETLHEQYPDSAEHAGLVIALARLYEGYAALVLDAYVLERALFLRRRGEGLPEFQASAIRLIELFDIDLSSSHLRGAPDTVFTVLTYAAVSLVHSVALAGRDSANKAAVLALARRASDVLARAAMTPDHLPAAQSVFLSRLIAKVGADAVSAEEASDITTLAGGQADEAAHARALAEPTTSIWPPRPAADPKRARATLAGAEYPAPPPALPRAALGLGVGSFRRTGLAARSGLSGLGGW